MKFFFRQGVVVVAAMAFSALARVSVAEHISDDRELKELDLTAWNCVNRPEGSGRSPDKAERNRLKNRFAVDLSGVAVKSFDTAGFLQHVAAFDAETKGKRRRDLSPEQKRRLQILEAPLVSLTAYLVLGLPGPNRNDELQQPRFPRLASRSLRRAGRSPAAAGRSDADHLRNYAANAERDLS